jgi:CBS domain-containing protein
LTPRKAARAAMPMLACIVSKPISSLMQRQVSVVEMDQTLGDVERLFAACGLGWAPVTDPQGEIVGVISAHDLVRLRAQYSEAASLPLWRSATYKPITVDAATPLSDVARQMVSRHVHHVVVTEHGRIAGVVSSFDFMRAFIDAEADPHAHR